MNPRVERAIQTTILVCLALLPAGMRVLLSVLGTGAGVDPDVFWHMRTGQWVLEHRATPATDPFSAFGQGKPWAAYSWLFEVLLQGAYSLGGWAGVELASVLCWIAIAWAVQATLARSQKDFTVLVVLVIAALVPLRQLMTPRPWIFTIAFFLVELELLDRVRRGGAAKTLLWLAPLFALWANIHIQFVTGLALFGIFVVDRAFARKDLKISVLALGACTLATLVNPYHVDLYRVIKEYGSHTAALELVAELRPPDFLTKEGGVVLAWLLAAVVGLVWKREKTPWPWLSLLFGLYFTLRSRRDQWILILVASRQIAETIQLTRPPTLASAKHVAGLALGGAAAIALGVLVLHAPIEKRLNTELASEYPTEACRVIDERGPPGPLFNGFDWGGYLIWRLPAYPVSMDGRTNLHGDARLARHVATLKGEDAFEDPDLRDARLVLISAKTPLGEVLRKDPRFELAFEDKVSLVFLRR